MSRSAPVRDARGMKTPSRPWLLVGLGFMTACRTTSAPGPHHATVAAFDLSADLHVSEGFWSLPYPSDLRLTPQGTADLSGFPNPRHRPELESLQGLSGRWPGFPQLPVAYFAMSGPIAARHFSEVVPAERDSPLLLLDVDPTSPERGSLWPVVAETPPRDGFVPENLLAVAPRPGMVLRPKRTYAFVVMRKLADASGSMLATPAAFARLMNEQAPAQDPERRAWQVHRPLWSALRALGIDPSAVAMATVFTTGDPVADLAVMSNRVLAKHRALIGGLHVRPDGNQPRNCELIGTITLPQFQQGRPPFDTGGGFQDGPDGAPIQQRDEVVPIAFSLPQSQMPANGYPLIVFAHGSAGSSTQMLDCGTRTPALPKGTVHQGPAHVVAERGFAMVSMAAPLAPERLPGAKARADVNFKNLAAYPFVYFQGVLEQRLLIAALSTFELDPVSASSCSGVSLPGGATAYKFDLSRLGFQGQSQGAGFANMVAAIEPRVGAIVPTGAGGFLSYTALVGACGDDSSSAPGATATKISKALGIPQPIVFLHPVMQLLQTAWEPADPLIFMPRVSRSPLEGHRARAIYEPVGLDDHCFPTPIVDAVALAYGHPQAGEVIWPSLQGALALAGRGGLSPYPVYENAQSDRGSRYTAAVVQFRGDGFVDSHYIFQQLDAVKYQYGCFFATFQKDGSGTIPAPAPLGTTCPGL